jgi:hypothetical protein
MTDDQPAAPESPKPPASELTIRETLLGIIDEVSVFAGFILVIVLAITFVLFAVGLFKPQLGGTNELEELSKKVDILSQTADNQAAATKRLEDIITKIANAAPHSDPSVAGKIATLEQQIAGLSALNKTIDVGLGEKAEKALSIPLLRKDISALKDAQTQESQRAHADVDRLYTLIQWLIGLMMTISISVLLPTLLHARKDSAE